jgi:CheY-like chemotaxis protein
MVRTLPSSFQNHRSPLRTDPSPIVFVIDDDPSLRRAIKRLVQSVGLDVETLGSAKEFLSTSGLDVPSCIILDARLPGMSGLDLQRELATADGSDLSDSIDHSRFDLYQGEEKPTHAQ